MSPWRLLLLFALAAASLAGTPAAAGTLPLPAGHRATEASVAIDFRDTRDVLVVARDEQLSGRVSLRTWRSHDSGRSFRGGWLVHGALAGAPADASNAVALFDAAGRPAPAFLALRYGTSTWDSRIMLGARVVVRDVYGPPIPTTLGDIYGARRWHDKPWAAIDPRDGRAYVAWTERWETATGPVAKIAVATARRHGRFSAPRVLGDGDGAAVAIGRGSSVLLAYYRQANMSERARIMVARSTDRGRTWPRRRAIASGVHVTGDPPFPALARSGSGFVACWQEYPRRWHPRIACARAPDGGSWSRPGVVAQPPRAGDAAQPALAAGPDGRLWLAFYRHGRRSTSVELWSARNAAAPWRPRGVLLRAPVPGSMLDFLGDYQGLAVGRTYGIAAFTLPSASHAFRQVIGVARFPTSRL